MSAAGFGGADEATRVDESVAAPTTPELAAAALAAVAAAASIPVEPVAVDAVAADSVETPSVFDSEPVAAPPAESEPAAVPPLSRRARRAPRVDEAVSSVPDAVLIPAEPFELLEPVVVTGPVILDSPIAEQTPVEQVTVESVVAEPLIAEPLIAEPLIAEPAAESWRSASDADEFEAAARLFSFTGETPIQSPAEAETAAPEDKHAGHRHARSHVRQPHVAARTKRPSTGAAFKRVTATSFSIGVMGIVGLLTVGMTTPAEAVAAASRQ